MKLKVEVRMKNFKELQPEFTCPETWAVDRNPLMEHQGCQLGQQTWVPECWLTSLGSHGAGKVPRWYMALAV